MFRSIFIIPLMFLFCVFCVPARADWCRVPGMTFGEPALVQCDGGHADWLSQCGEFNGETVWCYPAGGARSKTHKSHDNTTAMLIGVGVGLVVVAAAWYLFKKSPSENNPGQVQLATF